MSQYGSMTVSSPLTGAFILALGLLWSGQPSANELAQPHQLRYSVTVDIGIRLSGTMLQTLSLDSDDLWLFRRKVSSFFGFEAQENSLLSFEDKTVYSHVYSKRESGLGSNKESSFTTDKPDLYDTLTVTLQLALDLSEGEDIEQKVYRVQTEEDSFSDYRFLVRGREQIKTELGEIDTLRVEKIEKEGKKTIFWMMPDFHYLIAKAESTNPNGTDITLTLEKGNIGAGWVR